MKLKKSDRRRFSRGHGQSSVMSASASVQGASSVKKEAEWGLLSKENPIEPAVVVPPQTSYHQDTQGNSNKRGNWGVFGFGRTNHNRGADDALKEKSKSRKKAAGYTLSRTPKNMRNSSNSSTAPSVVSASSKQQQQQHPPPPPPPPPPLPPPPQDTTPSKPAKSKAGRTSSKKNSKKQQPADPSKTQKQALKVTSSSPQQPQSQPQNDQLFSDTEWMPIPLSYDGMINESGLMMRDTLIPTPHQQQHHYTHQPAEQYPMNHPDDMSSNMPGFEMTYENDADASRLTASTVATTAIMSTSSSSGHQESHTGFMPTDSTATITVQHSNASPPKKTSPRVSPRKTKAEDDNNNNHQKTKKQSPTSAKSKRRQSMEAAVAAVLSPKKSPTAATTISTPSSSKNSKKRQQKSPVAHAAAKALVALSPRAANPDEQEDDDDDFGLHDFDPEASSDSEESESDSDDDDDPTDASAGPLTVNSQESTSFQFNLASKNMKSASAAKKQPQEEEPDENDDEDDDGFRILKTRSSSSKLGRSPKTVGTQPTAISTMSSLTPNSTSLSRTSASRTSASRTSASRTSASASLIGTKIIQPQLDPDIKASASSGSSTLFPPSSVDSSSPSVMTLNSKGAAAAAAASHMSGSASTNNGAHVSVAKQQQAKLIVSRPFGRNCLPANVMPWVVQVAPAEWDNPERRWKYRIQVTKRQPTAQQQQQHPPESCNSINSSAVAVTWRSLENFVWLEEALKAEFQGALLLPLLNIAVGMTDLEQATHEVDAELLRNWLSDVLNGIRGQGELILGQQQHSRSIDMLQAEAVEAFLYRSTAPLQKPGNLITSMMGEAFVMKQELHKRQREHQRQQQQKQQNHRPVLEYEDTEVTDGNCRSAICKPSPRKSKHPISPSTVYSHGHRHEEEPESFVNSFWSRGPLSILTDELCVTLGCQVLDEESPSSTGSSVSSMGPGGNNNSKRKYGYSSRALGTADTLDIQDSFLDASTVASSLVTPAHNIMAKQQPPPAAGNDAHRPKQWKLAQSITLIQAQRDLVLSYRKTALSTMEKVQVLLEEEENIGLAWKRFGIAVSNLFSYEKEVESARLGEKKIHRDCMPYRKIKKSTVDQCVRALAQQKIDRSVPALRMLRAMLTAYVADLSAVGPSVEAYLEGMKQIADFEEYFSSGAKQRFPEDKHLKDGEGSVATDSTSSQSSSDGDNELKAATTSLLGTFQQHLRSFTSSRDGEEKKANDADLVRTNSTSSTSTSGDDVHSPEWLLKRRVEDRVLENERLLRESLTTLCKSTPMRTARMAYAYFRSEANQCRLLRSAAAALRNKTDLSVKEAVTQMVVRHQAENKEDMKTELSLAQRMVNLGKKRFPSSGNGNQEIDSDDQEHARALMRDNALQIARERVGRWNSDLAMAMMKAVGVDDPNVRVEQTTRELRLVRKYAIGLRENLNRCVEAVEILRKAVLKGGRQDLKGVDTRKKPAKHIMETRKEYFAEVAKLFSGVVLDDETGSPKSSASLFLPSTKPLSKAGILLNDPMGWSTPFVELSSQVINSGPNGKGRGDCGNVAKTYIEGRDSQTEWLLSSLSGLLNEYTQRVEVVESFVYMECVGVQLEKHFSQKRTEALSAFEKKTDVSTAINIATRKRIPGLVNELKAKLGRFGSDVTHTAVKEAKEAHLESKNIKSELHDLALRRLQRARETSTERVVDLLKVWMKEEESACITELNAIGEILECVETNFLRVLG
ncbi:expressed unknown protein [Seminavis robusta]|uniref:PX domain-containing protein n=1 Tax=Seminavis robusta TaxID=568900 RepID=A0A9N8EQ12_9STRA|nr:expressed unknown protein [Seminavis robusta]|eukprot:Sro1637_g287660.1 n/a (1729) ;mRNA; f:13736-19153